jgi:hypothetical protein
LTISGKLPADVVVANLHIVSLGQSRAFWDTPARKKHGVIKEKFPQDMVASARLQAEARR